MIIDKCLHSKSLKCHPTEEEARSLYTRKKFAIFEEEFKQAVTYKCKVGCAGMTTVYQVKKHVEGRSRIVNTRYNPHDKRGYS